MKRFIPILALVIMTGAAGAAPSLTDEPLDPDKAFRPQARLVAGEPAPGAGMERHGIDIEYRIAPGYYLYRSRLRFEVSPPTLLTGPAELPPGIEVDDQFLGKSAIFRESVTIHLPFVVSVVKAGRYRIRITAQGCAEERICYSPFHQEVELNIPPGYRVTDAPGPPPSRDMPR
ncbi:MAG: protein-disulfide reductase DsbD N-terminal domain-containing protein [Betaproteobacteria bacterium]|nr:protein-disulfide reductase DsbD N-terminal domain-containing protein [Betaproteobacteria bacterium]